MTNNNDVKCSSGILSNRFASKVNAGENLKVATELTVFIVIENLLTEVQTYS